MKHSTAAPPPLPKWLRGTIRRRKYGSIVLHVAMDTARAEKPVLYSIDGDEWSYTPFQTATFRHCLDRATVHDVWRWLSTGW